MDEIVVVNGKRTPFGRFGGSFRDIPSVELGGLVIREVMKNLPVDEKEIDEPYVRYPCDWNLSPRHVEKDCVYVVGDNRNMPIENHVFGQTSIKRIVGVPLW